MSGPRFEPVDEQTGSLLDLLAEEHPATPTEREEWATFTHALQVAARDGHIDQNDVRPLIRGRVGHKRIGAFYHRAATQGLIRPDGWAVSDDREGRNTGKPTRTYTWLGGAA